MNELNGYVKIHRKLLQWGWYQDHAVKEVWLHLLLTASFKECHFRGKKILPGQCIVGTEQMAKDLGFTRQQIRTAITKLSSTNEITVDSTNRFSIITLVNWAEYQLKDNVGAEKRDIKKSSAPPSGKENNTQQAEQKKPFAEFVTMTDSEYRDLIGRFGESDTKRMIEILDNYKGSHGVKYTSDYRTMLSWVKDRLSEEKQKQSAKPESLYSDTFNHEELQKLTRRKSQ